LIRVVLDTNVVISGLLSPSGPPGRINDLLTHRLIQIVYGDAILVEYADVLWRRELKILLPDAADALLEEIQGRGTAVAIAPWAIPVPDGSDSIFLATALIGQAVVITGNLHHFPSNVRLGVEVLSPRAFVDRHAINIVPLRKHPEDLE